MQAVENKEHYPIYSQICVFPCTFQLLMLGLDIMVTSELTVQFIEANSYISTLAQKVLTSLIKGIHQWW